MREMQLLQLIGQADDKYIEEAAPCRKPAIQRWRRYSVLAACLALVTVLGIAGLSSSRGLLPLSAASEGVTVRRISHAPQIASAPCLVFLSEEELFTHFSTAIFKGSITKIDNIELDFNGRKNYRALAQIQVEQVWRGDCRTGDVVTVLLPCPVGNGTFATATETVSEMRVGMRGIFMPMIYDESSISEENGARLALKDVADYGFADGVRYAFLETGDGLIFSRSAYESIADVQTLDEIEVYIQRMLDQTGE